MRACLSVFCNLRCIARFDLMSAEDCVFAWRPLSGRVATRKALKGSCQLPVLQETLTLASVGAQWRGFAASVTPLPCIQRGCLHDATEPAASPRFWHLVDPPPPRQCTLLLPIAPPPLTQCAPHWGALTLEGNIIFFLSVKPQRDERTLFSPLGPGAASPLLSLHVLLKPRWGAGGWACAGRLGDQRRSRESGAEYRSAAGGTDAQPT